MEQMLHNVNVGQILLMCHTMHLVALSILILIRINFYFYCWSALAPTPAQLQLGAKEAINSIEMLPFVVFVSNHKSN